MFFTSSFIQESILILVEKIYVSPYSRHLVVAGQIFKTWWDTAVVLVTFLVLKHKPQVSS